MNELSLYRCLASPTRVGVLKVLRSGEHSVGDLALAIGVEQSNLSHQLRELRGCGLVQSRQEGKRVLCSLSHARLGELLDLAAELAAHLACDPDQCVECC